MEQFSLNKDSLITAKPGVLLQEEQDNWGFLYNPENDLSFGVNPVSAFIWKQLETPHPFGELVTKVKTACTNAPANIEDEILAFIKNLVEKELITLESTQLTR